MDAKRPKLSVRDLTMAYGTRIIQHDLTFDVKTGDVFIIMGGSGCGKSTLMRHMIGLQFPAKGDVLYEDRSFIHADPEERDRMKRRFGVLYQSGALWSSMTLIENVSLPLEEYTPLTRREAREVASVKLALVGLAGYEDYYPSRISGGMRKRAALARAMALDPDVLFLDEPSAGLDPITSRLLDELIGELRDSLGATVVMVTHELAGIFALGDDSIFLDAGAQTAIARGSPRKLLEECDDPQVRRFLTRGKEEPALTRRGSSEAPEP